MAITFSCPNCGAPLEYPGGDLTTLPCQYCHHTIIVPPEIRTANPAVPAPNQPVPTADAASPTNPALQRLNDLQKQGVSDREYRRIERAKRRIVRREVREEVRRSRHG